MGKRSLPYEMIGSGPLALRPSPAFGWIARLADELNVIAYNSRPDIELPQAQILLKLKNGKEQLTVLNGKTFYLKESQEGKGLIFSPDPTSLWVKPILLDSGSILLEVGRKLISKEGEEGEEKGQFIANLQGLSVRHSSTIKIPLFVLQSAHFFSQDLLMQRYAGREYASLNQKTILDITTSLGSYALLISPGDYLLYEGNEWHVVGFQDLKIGDCIAYVRSISEKGIEIEAWDESGFCPTQVKIEKNRQQRPAFGSESMPSAIRLRTGTQVSCAFGKKRLILKQGDWLLKTANGWRNLRSAEDLQLYLERRLKGDLFVFDQIEKDPQGKFFMKGHFFDDTRTFMQSVSLPINIDKQQIKSSRKRRSANRGIK